jgi:hypothetical protein
MNIVVTNTQIREINISNQARALRFLRFTDYMMVIVCGSWLFGIFSHLALGLGVFDYEVITVLIGVGVLAFNVYTGFCHIGVIDPSVWLNYIIGLPMLLLFSVFLFVITFNELRGDVLFDPEIFLSLYAFLYIAAIALAGIISVLLLKIMRIRSLNLTLAKLLSNFRGQIGLRALRVTSIKRINAPRGIVFGVVGVTILLGVMLIPLPQNRAMASRTLQSLEFLRLLGFLLLIKARQYFQVSADSLLAVDKRSPILFLRAFDDDDKKKSLLEIRKALLDFSLETRLANHFRYFGPFIAIGSPRDTVPQLGAARVVLSDREWQPRVMSWMSEAGLIIMYSGTTNWVNWELTKIIEMGRVTNLILMIPEIKGWRRSKRSKNISKRIESVKDVFNNTKWSVSLAAFQDFLSVRAMLFGADGSVTVIRSGPHNRDSYHLAALIAHYLILNQDTVPVAQF